MAIVVLWGAAVPRAHAEPSADTATGTDTSAEAKRHFEQGVALYREQDFRAAQFEFERAHALSGNYRILYNIALASLDGHDYAGAKRAFEGYLAQGGDSIPASRRDEIDGELALLAPRVGSLGLKVNVVGATISIDGREVGTAPLSDDLLVNLGERRLEVSAAGFTTAQKVFDVEGGQRTVLKIRLQVLPGSTPRPSGVPKPPELKGSTADASSRVAADHRRLRALEVSTWVGVGITGVGGAAALATGLLALDSNQDLARERDRIPADPLRVEQLQSRTERLALASDVLVGVTASVAVVTLALGITALLTRKRQRERTRARTSSNPLTIQF